MTINAVIFIVLCCCLRWSVSIEPGPPPTLAPERMTGKTALGILDHDKSTESRGSIPKPDVANNNGACLDGPHLEKEH